MNKGSATGSRDGSVFGLDLKSGEIEIALKRLYGMTPIDFRGFHMHIGTGITNADAYMRAIKAITPAIKFANAIGLPVEIMDMGGGLASPTAREMTSFEMLRYAAFNSLPGYSPSDKGHQFKTYADALCRGITTAFRDLPLPELILEPGRCLVSQNQLLLLRVHDRKERGGTRKWLVTDGGIGTVTMPTYYEFHEVLLCNDVYRPKSEKITIAGPGCFAADIVYHKRNMPKVAPGEVIAIMDSGAYFTSWESSFGYPRPAIVGVRSGISHIMRSRETFEQMTERDNNISLPSPNRNNTITSKIHDL
jgi:diaminopimelate decarboxylase